MMQLDLFGTTLAVSRWPGDGPFKAKPANVWHDRSNGSDVLTWFDGVGHCQAACAPCRHCGVWHPLDPVNHDPVFYSPIDTAKAYRCPHGEGWWEGSG